jgi:DMSO/TMAO reductase YedYZ molybdopterin-dependent catalytic subunit
MNKRILLTIVTVLALTLLIGCSAAAPTPTPEPEPTPTAQTPDATLTVQSGNQSITLTWDDIQAMPAYEGLGGLINSVGNVMPPSRYKGVPLEDLCGLVGGITEANSVRIVASDGYAMAFSYDQVATGNFDTYDPVTGENAPFDGKLWAVIAYEREGELLPEKEDGQFRLTILGSPKMVTDGHWWVKWVETIEVKEALDQWTLHLEGALSEDIDRGTFETGAAPNCHGISWSDEDRTWTGIPLWLLVGRVDDENEHEEGAFNDDLAEAGYEINVIASDGYSVTFDSAAVARNDDIIVAYLMNDAPLQEKNWPLRLVGPNLESSQSVGKIITIELAMP